MKTRNHHPFSIIRSAGLLSSRAAVLGTAYGVVTVKLGAVLQFVALGLAMVGHAESSVQESLLAGRPDWSEHLVPKPAPEARRIS